MIVKPQPDLSEITRAVDAIVRREKGRIIEVRALDTPEGTYSGYYNNSLLVQDVFDLSSIETTPAVFWTIQDINTSLLRTGHENKLYAGAKETTSDKDVRRFLWIPIDCDPVRKAGVSSTDAEKAAALKVANSIRAFLSSLGIDSILGDSGNGYHVLVPIDILNQNGTNKLISRVLEALNARFGTSEVKVDTSTCNPSRILKIYGSVARKGPHTDERPWRLSRLVDVPVNLTALDEERVKGLLAELTKGLSPELTAKAEVQNERGKIPHGSMYPALISEVGALRQRGYSVEAIETALIAWADENCESPIDFDKVRKYARAAEKWEPGNPANAPIVNGKIAGVPVAQPQAAAQPQNAEPSLTEEEARARATAARELERKANEANGVYTHLIPATPGTIPWIMQHTQNPSEIPPDKTQWIIDRMLMLTGLHIRCALPGGQKSILSLMSAKAVGTATPLLGRTNIGRPFTVVIVDRENPTCVVRERVEGLGLLEENVCEHVRIWGDWLGDTPDMFDDPRLVQCAQLLGQNVFFVFDSLSAFSEGADENSVKEMNPILRKVLRLSRISAGSEVLHHTDKQGMAARGTIAIRANGDMVFKQEVNKEGVVKLCDERFRPTLPWTMEFTMDWGGDTGIYTPKLLSDSLNPMASTTTVSQEAAEAERIRKQADAEAQRNHYIKAALEKITKAYAEAVEGRGECISSRTQLATLTGTPKRVAENLFDGRESNPWTCVPGARNNAVVYLPKGVTVVPPSPDVIQRGKADALFQEGKTVQSVSEALDIPFGTVNRWRTAWGKATGEADRERARKEAEKTAAKLAKAEAKAAARAAKEAAKAEKTEITGDPV